MFDNEHENDHRDDEESNPFFDYLNDGERGKGYGTQLGRKTLYDSSQEELHSILIKTLKDLPALCPKCGYLCTDHAIDLRDAFIKRIGEISRLIVEGVDAYSKCRKFGVIEPIEVIEKIYSLVSEQSVIYAFAEPNVDISVEPIDELTDEE